MQKNEVAIQNTDTGASSLVREAQASQRHASPGYMQEAEERLILRHASMEDLDAITAVEAACFPVAEAATREEFAERIRYYGNHFWLLYEGNQLISFVDGFVTNEENLTDEMYAQAELHDEKGAWQMIFGVNTLPAYRKKGYAGRLLRQAMEEARQQGRKGLVLTCKDQLRHFYASFGFVEEGISASTHGNVTWYQMRLRF